MPLLCFFFLSILFATPMEVFGDGSEFAISVGTLGLSHPPSYPLFIILGKLFYYLPFANIAFRVNLFSSLTAALVSYVAYKIYDGDETEKWFFGLIVFFTRSFFLNAMTGEVYALNLLFFITILYLLRNIKDKRYFYLSNFLLGVGAGNHHTLLFMTIYMIYILFREKSRLGVKDIMVSFFLFLLGFSVYLYLPLRTTQPLIWNWGNPKNFELFLNSFLRHDFKPEGMARDLPTLISQILTINPFYEFGIIPALFFVIGFFMLYKKDKRHFFEICLLSLLFSVLIILLLGNDKLTPEERKETYAVFFIPAYFLLVYGAFCATKDVKKRLKIGILSICLLMILYSQRDGMKNLIHFDKAVFAHDLARAELSSLPRDAVLITQGGELDFPLLYQQQVGKFREDIKVINLTRLGKKWNAKESLELGTTYTKGYEGEINSKRQILKAVILFQSEFKNKRVFLNIFDEEELPETIKYIVNGLFYEYGQKELLTLDFVRERSLNGASMKFAEVIKAAKEEYERQNIHREAERARELLQKITE